MPDATPAAAPAAPAPATPPAAPATRAPAASSSPAGDTKTPGQPTEAQRQTMEAPKQESTAEEMRRSIALAKQKRAAAKQLGERQRLEAERRTWQEQQSAALKKAQDFDRLSELAKKDPLAFTKEVGIDFRELAKAQIAESTGQGKTPAEFIREEVQRIEREREQKAAEDAARRAGEDNEQRVKQTRAAVARQMGEIIQGRADDFDLCSRDPDRAIESAFTAIQRFWDQTFVPDRDPMGRIIRDASGRPVGRGQVLALDKALAGVEELLTQKFAESKKLGTLFEQRQKAAAEAEKAAKEKAAATAQEQPLSSFHRSQPMRSGKSAAAEAQSEAPNPTHKKRSLYINHRAEAEKLLAELRQKHDN